MFIILKHASDCGPGMFGRRLSQRNVPHRTIELHKGDKLPSGMSGITAVLALGGGISIHDSQGHPFLPEETRFIRETVEEGIPYFGICLGAQLLAHVFGAEVYPGHQKEVGWFRAELTMEGRQDRLFAGVPSWIDAFQWHVDTFDVPKGGVLLANGNVVRNQTFRLGWNAYGFQYHIEADKGIISKWFKDDPRLRDNIGYLARIEPGYSSSAEIIFDNFINIAAG